TGIPNLMVPVISLDALKRVKPNWDMLNRLAQGADYLAIEVFTKEAKDVTSDAHARHFAPALGVEEDPVTGSAAGGLGSYLIHHGIISSSNTVSTIVIEQGHFMDRPGKVIVEVTGGRNEIKMVKVSGTAVTVAKGKVYV
ncbi:MAG: PhzF family phenazine biosynthesis protein, partial [Candidatus Thorarchaeota archaeon]